MAISALELPAPSGAVEAACAALRPLDHLLWSARGDDELVGVVEALEELRSEVAALEAQVLAELDERQVPKRTLGWGSTADWFTHLAGLRRGQGKRAVEHARELVRSRRSTLAALHEGSVSPEQAAVVLDAVEALPSAPSMRARAEEVLLEEAGRLDATSLAKAGARIGDVVDPDREDRDLERALEREERAAHVHRFLSIAEDGAGGVRLSGRGSVEDAAVLRAALLPLTAPVPTVDPDTCAEQPDPRDHGARLWDALVATAHHTLTSDLAPECHGARPRVTVTTDLATLQQGLGRGGVTDDGLELSVSAVRRIACDADVIPAVLGSRSEVLDVGRLQRLVTAAIWRALVLRDQHCRFPGCTRPPVMCHAHHVEHWVDGGETSLANLVLLCGHHHRLIHGSPWQVRISAEDGLPEFLPPPRADTTPEWIRSRPRRE